MPVLTAIIEQKRRPNRRNIHLDGRFAFACKLNVVAKFRLREGMVLSDEQVGKIEQGEVRQECLDDALKFLERRLHSRSELGRKLRRREYVQTLIDEVLDELAKLGYIDDERFARARAQSAAKHKYHGRNRAKAELMKAGVKGEAVERALNSVYNKADSLTTARRLAQKQAARLSRLDPVVARRRLAGMLQRRGFEYDSIKPVIDELLNSPEPDSDA